jgi:hypothetical protein
LRSRAACISPLSSQIPYSPLCSLWQRSYVTVERGSKHEEVPTAELTSNSLFELPEGFDAVPQDSLGITNTITT